MTTDKMNLKCKSIRIGKKQTMKTVELGEAAQVIVAQDADPRMVRDIVELCTRHHVELVYMDTMRNLGNACGIGVNAAMVAVSRE